MLRVAQVLELLLLVKSPTNLALTPAHTATTSSSSNMKIRPFKLPPVLLRLFEEFANDLHRRQDNARDRVERRLGQTPATRDLTDVDESLLDSAKLRHGVVVLLARASRLSHKADESVGQVGTHDEVADRVAERHCLMYLAD